MNSPRALFQKLHKDEAAKLAVLVNEAWFQKAVTYARAEMSFMGVESERVKGANQFLEVLTTLADEQKPVGPPPDKQLQSYG